MDARALTDQAGAAGFAPWGAVDGQVLTGQLVDVFDHGQQAPVPLLAGFNSGEIRSLTFLLPPAPSSPAQYEALIRAHYGDLADAFLSLYPSSDVHDSMLRTTRDALYGWTAQRLAIKQTALGQPAYLYLWDHGFPAADDKGLHGFHASEVPFVFGTLDLTPPYWPKAPDTDEARSFSHAMTAYWASFAKTGVPQAPGQPDWPAYGVGGRYMAFHDAPQPSEHLLPGMYELNEAVVCRRHAAGGQGWNWNVGVIAPRLPAKTAACAQPAP